jgi:hypothetical protein
MLVRFRTVRDPPNLDAVKIQHVALAFARKDGSSFEMSVSGFRFVEEGSLGATGGAATSIDGIISTRRGNAGTWMSFVGKRPFGSSVYFSNEDVEDILLVITYSARTPDWPA